MLTQNLSKVLPHCLLVVRHMGPDERDTVAYSDPRGPWQEDRGLGAPTRQTAALRKPLWISGVTLQGKLRHLPAPAGHWNPTARKAATSIDETCA